MRILPQDFLIYLSICLGLKRVYERLGLKRGRRRFNLWRLNIKPVQDMHHCVDEGKRVVSTLITEEELCDAATTPPVRSCADPLLGCRPKGSVSRFWVVFDDEFSDAESSLSTLEMVRQATVHGFSK
jgi:hypothetical protein